MPHRRLRVRAARQHRACANHIHVAGRSCGGELTVAFSDPDLGDTHTGTADWDDGTTSTSAEANVSISGRTLPPRTPTSSSLTRAGFVTRGGWIHSPSSAYAADPLLSGRASFGFVSRCVVGG